MKIYRLPAFQDNYIFLLHDPQTQTAAVVDPGDATPVLQKLQALEANLVAIFNTHHHRDHTGGNRALLQTFPDAIVYGSDFDQAQGRIFGQQVVLQDGDRVEFGGRTAEVIFAPGHTLGHIAYYFPPANANISQQHDHKAQHDNADSMGDLFCGDVLFSAGCGRLFEGTAQQAVDSMSRLRQLPNTTRVWCAHEYTQANLQFALTVDGQNPDLHAYHQWVQTRRAKHQPTIPSSIGLERKINPFLRWDEPQIQQAVGLQDPARTFAALRQLKESQ